VEVLRQPALLHQRQGAAKLVTGRMWATLRPAALKGPAATVVEDSFGTPQPLVAMVEHCNRDPRGAGGRSLAWAKEVTPSRLFRRGHARRLACLCAASRAAAR
jgi:hypothetical protein